MAYKLVVPRLGLTMETGTIIQWHKADGDSVRVGDLVFAVETDKAVQDFESPAAGVLQTLPELRNKPAAWQGQVALRKMVTLSLTFDHRGVDGGPATRFLNHLREYVEDPYLWTLS